MTEYFILFLVIVFLLFAIMVSQAPVGYEDEDGFHYGLKPEDKLKEDKSYERYKI